MNTVESILSREECLKIVQKTFGENSQLVEYVIAPVDGEKKGFLGDYFTLKITARDDQNNSVQNMYFIKAPVLPQDSTDDTKHIFMKEAFLYSSLLKDFTSYSKTKWKPECYLARDDILVLENLTQLNYESLPSNIEVNINHMKVFLSSLAAFHACSIAYENDAGQTIGSMYRENIFETSIIKELQWFQAGVTGLQAIATAHPKYQSDEYQSFIQNRFIECLDPVYEMINESNRFRNVLCHGDTWQNNGLFVFEEGDYTRPLKCALVDFQICRYCPPAIDVLLTIYLNTNRSQRLKIIPECFQWYHQQLTRELDELRIDINDHITWESFLKSCHELKLVAVLYSGVAATLVNLPDGFLNDLRANNPEELASYRMISREKILLELIEKHEAFRICMFETVEDLMNIIYKIE